MMIATFRPLKKSSTPAAAAGCARLARVTPAANTHDRDGLGWRIKQLREPVPRSSLRKRGPILRALSIAHQVGLVRLGHQKKRPKSGNPDFDCGVWVPACAGATVEE